MPNDTPSSQAPPAAAPSGRAPTHAERCRALAAQTKSATLATIARDPAGFPYASLVAVAFDGAGRPLLVLSELAEHTGNLHEHPEASILLTEAADADPLALGRVTILGLCSRVPDAERAAVREAFLSEHPAASQYVDFRDFGFYRMEPTALRYIGGFGRMSWVAADEYRAAQPVSPPNRAPVRDAEIRAALDWHWAASNAGDDAGEGEIYHEDVVLEYPQSGERFVGRRNVLESRGHNPAARRFELRRTTGSGDLWIIEYVIFYDDRAVLTVSIMQFRDGKVASETQYFADPFEAPEWRARWREESR